MASYQSILEYARLHKNEILEDMKVKTCSKFMSIINNEGIDQQKELLDLRVEERAISLAGNVIENVIEKMEKGAT